MEEKAVSRSQKNIEDIVKIKSNEANLILENNIEVVEVEKLKINDKILIKPGEKVPVDCKVISRSFAIGYFSNYRRK